MPSATLAAGRLCITRNGRSATRSVFSMDDEIAASELEQLLSDDAVSSLLDGNSLCWGGALQGDTSCCTPGFVPQPNHFKNKLCPRCRRDGLVIPRERICALSASDSEVTMNKQGTGLWSPMGSTMCRLINHTSKCTGPPLLIFLDPQAEGASWAPMPSGWLEPDGLSMKLVVACGTLRPASAMHPANRRSSGLASSSAAGAGSVMIARPDEDDEVSGKRARLGHACDERAASTADTGTAEAGTADTGVADKGVADTDARVANAGIAWIGTPGTAIAADVAADAVALSAALKDPAFLAAQEGQLRACAAALPSLDRPARSAMYEMYCGSTKGALCTIAGETALRHVLEANSHSGTVQWSAVCPNLSDDDTVRLVIKLGCLQDEDVWTKVLESHAAASATATAVAPPPQPASSQLERLSDDFARVALSGADVGEAPPLESAWYEYVQRMVALIPRGVSATSHGASHSLEADDVQFNVLVDEQRCIVFTLVEVCADEPNASEAQSVCGGRAAQASAILHHLLHASGFRAARHFSASDALFQLEQLPSDLATDGSAFERLAYDLAVRLMGLSTLILRMFEQRLADGCRLILVHWDVEADRPLYLDEDAKLASVNVLTLTFDSGVGVKPWRLSVAKAAILPDAVLRWPITTLAKMLSIESLFKSSIRRLLSRLRSVIAAFP